VAAGYLLLVRHQESTRAEAANARPPHNLRPGPGVKQKERRGLTHTYTRVHACMHAGEEPGQTASATPELLPHPIWRRLASRLQAGGAPRRRQSSHASTNTRMDDNVVTSGTIKAPSPLGVFVGVCVVGE